MVRTRAFPAEKTALTAQAITRVPSAEARTRLTIHLQDCVHVLGTSIGIITSMFATGVEEAMAAVSAETPTGSVSSARPTGPFTLPITTATAGLLLTSLAVNAIPVQTTVQVAVEVRATAAKARSHFTTPAATSATA